VVFVLQGVGSFFDPEQVAFTPGMLEPCEEISVLLDGQKILVATVDQANGQRFGTDMQQR